MAAIAVYQDFIRFDSASDSTSVDGRVLSFARLDAWGAFVAEFLVEKESRGGSG